VRWDEGDVEYTALSLYAKTWRKAARADEGEESGELEQAEPDAVSEAEPHKLRCLPKLDLHRKPLRHWRDVRLTTQPSGLSIGGLCRFPHDEWGGGQRNVCQSFQSPGLRQRRAAPYASIRGMMRP